MKKPSKFETLEEISNNYSAEIIEAYYQNGNKMVIKYPLLPY